MVLTYRSTGQTEIFICERDSDGTQRVARAIQDEANPRQWRAQLEHPSGIRPCSQVYGSRGDVALALSHYLHVTETEWRAEKARGHKPEARPADRNVQVDIQGNTIGAPVYGTIRRI